MKKLFLSLLMLLTASACQNKKSEPVTDLSDSTQLAVDTLQQSESKEDNGKYFFFAEEHDTGTTYCEFKFTLTGTKRWKGELKIDFFRDEDDEGYFNSSDSTQYVLDISEGPEGQLMVNPEIPDVESWQKDLTTFPGLDKLFFSDGSGFPVQTFYWRGTGYIFPPHGEMTDSLMIKSVYRPTAVDIAQEIMESSPAYKTLTSGLLEKIEKNGGTSFGFFVEGSPESIRDIGTEYSKTYDFSLHESYPDHAVTFARFRFDPDKKQLYQYHEAGDSLQSIEFDKRLLSKFERVRNQKRNKR